MRLVPGRVRRSWYKQKRLHHHLEEEAEPEEAKKINCIYLLLVLSKALHHCLCCLRPTAYVVAGFPIVLRYGRTCASYGDTARGVSDKTYHNGGLPLANGVE